MHVKPIVENRILKLEERLKLLKDKIRINKTIWNNKNIINLETLLEELRDIKELFRLIADDLNKPSSVSIVDINNELCILDKKIFQLELNLLFNSKTDRLGCYLDIQAGSGGIESQDWTSILLRMYLRWSDKHKFKAEVVHEISGEINKAKSVTIKILGAYAFGWLRTEAGIHRLVRKSPFNSNGKRHTSFSSIYVYPVLDEEVNIAINPSELRIDTFRSSGAGGQHVNKTDSAVRITHLPTNIVSECQDERSQYRNKTKALIILAARIRSSEITRKQKEDTLIKKTLLGTGYRNDRIRTYNFQQNRITDHRIELTIYKLTEVLNGDLDLLIQPILNRYYYEESI